MKLYALLSRTISLSATGLLLVAGTATAAEIKVMSSAGFSTAYKNLLPGFESTSGNTVVNAWGPSMGDTPQAVPNRMARGEPVDVVIVAGEALDGLIKDGKVMAASRTDLAQAVIGMAVRAGAPKPDIGTVEALKRTLLAAKSIAYSDSASGVYLSTVLFPRLGIADRIRDKAKMIPATPVGEVVASGDYEIGFQTISELIAIEGIDVVGPIPAEAQKTVTFSAGIAAAAKEPDAGAALIKYLASPDAAPAIVKSGMVPAMPANKK